jgi:hypothetical protein
MPILRAAFPFVAARGAKARCACSRALAALASNRAKGLVAIPLAALLAPLAGCAGGSAGKPSVDQHAVDRYRASGYSFATQEGVSVHRFTAPVSQIAWSFALVQAPPRAGSSRPVIVYQPALGESDDAPCAWTEKWARAGYAVVQLQPLDDDAHIWATPEARSGDFERVARGRFADDLMADRIARLARLVAQTRARSEAGEPALAGLDWNRVALAGADLGAYTVQSIAALSPEQLRAGGWTVTPRAFIVISPFAKAAEAGAAASASPAGASAPVLMISSEDDVDAYGVITDVALRHAAFDRLASGDDFYLELHSASHRWLGGMSTDQLNSPEAVARRTPTFREPSAGAKRPGPSASEGVAPDEDLTPEATAQLAATRKEREMQLVQARSRLMTRVAMNEVGFEDVSTAFLDTYLRQDARAKSWLLESAAAWLQDGDRLKHR